MKINRTLYSNGIITYTFNERYKVIIGTKLSIHSDVGSTSIHSGVGSIPFRMETIRDGVVIRHNNLMSFIEVTPYYRHTTSK